MNFKHHAELKNHDETIYVDRFPNRINYVSANEVHQSGFGNAEKKSTDIVTSLRDASLQKVLFASEILYIDLKSWIVTLGFRIERLKKTLFASELLYKHLKPR